MPILMLNEISTKCISSSRERTRLADTVPDSPNKLSRFVVGCHDFHDCVIGDFYAGGSGDDEDAIKDHKEDDKDENDVIRIKMMRKMVIDINQKLSRAGLATDVSSVGSRWQWTRYTIIIIIIIVIIVIIIIHIIIVIIIIKS